MKKYILIIGILAGGFSLWAQDLHKEITVDRTVQPNVREATRLNGVTPAILQPRVEAVTLSAAEYTRPGELTADLSVLPPAAWADSIDHAGYRGYASVGYLPLFNFGANVGYRFIDTPRYGVGLWAQYNGASYNGDIPHFNEALFTNHTLNVGGSGSIRFSKYSLLSAKGKVNLRSVRTPYFLNVNGDEFRRSYTQLAQDASAEAKWQSKVGRTVYAIKGELGYFNLNDDIVKDLSLQSKSARQAIVGFGGSVGVADDGTTVPWVGIDADLKAMRSTNLLDLQSSYRPKIVTENLWLGHITPYLRFDNPVLEGLVGFNLTIAKGYGGKTRIAPMAQINYRPVKPLTMYAKVSGDQKMNMMSELFDINPYLLPTLAYGRTNIPIMLTGGLNVGPYDGMSLGLSGGYTKARGQLTPLITIYKDGHMESTFEATDVNSWYFGAEIAYAYRQWFVLSASVKCGGSDLDTATWYEWVDGAKVIADVGLKVTPTEDIEIDLSYNMRYDRKCRSVIYPYNENSMTVQVGIPNLGTVNSVNLGGRYKINEQVTAFLEADNLLMARYKLISGMPGPGLHGLLGVSCKF